MQPNAQLAMRTALELGPDHCPPDLFRGDVPQLVLGLKAYANNIAVARLRALEDSFPRTRALVGEETFHAMSKRHLTGTDALARPLSLVGKNFANLWKGPAADLAATEWAWLQAYGAGEARAVRLVDLAGLSEAALIELRVRAHPAARLVTLASPAAFAWDEPIAGRGPIVLLSRPQATISLLRLAPPAGALWRLLSPATTLGELLALDPAVTTIFIQAGALVAEGTMA